MKRNNLLKVLMVLSIISWPILLALNTLLTKVLAPDNLKTYVVDKSCIWVEQQILTMM